MDAAGGPEDDSDAPANQPWAGAGLVLVMAADLAIAAPVLAALAGLPGASVRRRTGAVQLASRIGREVEHNLLANREVAGGASALEESERVRIGIVAQSTAARYTRELAADLVAFANDVLAVDLLVEPIAGPSDILIGAANLLPDARLVVVEAGDEGLGDVLVDRFGIERVLAVTIADPDASAHEVARFLGRDLPNAPARTDAATPADVPHRVPDPADDAVVVYRPQARLDLGYVAAWRSILRTVRTHRDLAWQMFRRDFFAPYRSSYLGMSWLVIAPLLAMVQWLVVQRNGVLDAGDIDVPYPVYVLLGTTMWTMFMGIYTATKITLTSSGHLLLQINFPREILVFKQLGQQLATFLVSLAVTLVVLGAYAMVPAWQAIALPLVLLPLVLMATAFGLIVAMIAVVAVDLDRLLMTVWAFVLWLTPVVYKLGDTTGGLATVVRWNPLTYLVLAPRDLILYGELAHPQGFLIASGLAMVLFIAAGRLFHVSEPQLVERLL